MTRKAKTFGVNKHSKRRSRRKQRARARVPEAIVPRAHVAVVYQLFESRRRAPVTLDPAVERFMP